VGSGDVLSVDLTIRTKICMTWKIIQWQLAQHRRRRRRRNVEIIYLTWETMILSLILKVRSINKTKNRLHF
jgi:hypothetical protein